MQLERRQTIDNFLSLFLRVAEAREYVLGNALAPIGWIWFDINIAVPRGRCVGRRSGWVYLLQAGTRTVQTSRRQAAIRRTTR